MSKNYTQNREISWLRFNERVLEQAGKKEIPLLERLKFISIFISNLDEFFMIRMGTLTNMKTLKVERPDTTVGISLKEEINQIIELTRPLYAKKDNIYAELMQELKENGICEVVWDQLSRKEKKDVKEYFKSYILPILSPQIIDKHHPFPHLHNKQLHYVGFVKMHKKKLFSLIPIPASVPDLYYLTGEGIRYIRIENIILEMASLIFTHGEIMESAIVRATRNEDINLNCTDLDMEDYYQYQIDTDIRKEMRELLHKRKRLAVVRVEHQGEISDELKSHLCNKLKLKSSFVFGSKTPLDLKEVNLLVRKYSIEFGTELLYQQLQHDDRQDLYIKKNITKMLTKKDALLCYPRDSVKPFLDLIKESSQDKKTLSIKITIYRLSSHPKLVEYLCNAAENGVDVTVLIELRARFDESNNIAWSERLEASGCSVIYGFEDYKVHSKICLITKRVGDEIQYITQIGTGNYNESTCRIYTDLSLITSDADIGKDAVEFFRNMGIGNLSGAYTHLLVGPFKLKKHILDLIDEQIKLGKDGLIKLKVNGLADNVIIEKLREASKAGVEIKLCVRGICCILPGVDKETDNLEINSVVGRYLEHSRIYCFGKNGSEKVFISSADLLHRNMDRRIEVAVPVIDGETKLQVIEILNLALQDNVNGRLMNRDGKFQLNPCKEGKVNSQLINEG